MKHAYLIIAHHEFEILKRLISALDDERNDIYIHLDKKIKKLPKIELKKARLFQLKKRLDIRWGDVSQIKSEFLLFKSSFINGPYAYYHLLSGVDMPLKSQDEIHEFFDHNQGKEFVGFNQKITLREIDRKVKRYHLFPMYFKSTKNISGFIRRFLRFSALRLQYILCIQRHKEIDFKKGTSWVSVTNDFVKFLIPKYDQITKMYAYSFCADEFFLHTVCWNSPFKDKLFDSKDEARGCKRLIGWKDNQLVSWTNNDYHYLMTSEALYARKFNGRHLELVDKILDKITNDA